MQPDKLFGFNPSGDGSNTTGDVVTTGADSENVLPYYEWRKHTPQSLDEGIARQQYEAFINSRKGGTVSGSDVANKIDPITGRDSEVYGSTDVSGFDQASWALEQQWKLDQAEREYNSAEATKQRDWEKMMSDTAIQRAVADIKAAGLNPWLALNGGSVGPASTPSGASASSSSGSSKVPQNYLYQMLASMMNTASSILKALV